MRSYIKNTISLADELQKLDPNRIPGEKEIREAVRKRLTKGHLTMIDLCEEDALQAGDAVKVKVESTLPRFNKASVTVNVGGGLYDKVLEAALVGRHIGDVGTVNTRDVEVRYTVLSAQRMAVPEPTDAMVEEQGVENIHTVAEFTRHLGEQLQAFAWSQLIYDFCNHLEDIAEVELDQEELKKMDGLIRDMWLDIMRENGIEDPVNNFPDKWKEAYEADSFDDFVQRNCKYNEGNLRACLAMGNALGIALEGECDPLTEVHATNKLMGLIGDKVKEDIMRRKA